MSEQNSGFDISAQAELATREDEGTVVHIHDLSDRPMFFDRNGTNVPVTITVAGTHSKRYRRAEEQLRKRKLRSRNLTGEVIYEDNIEKLAACTLEWDGFFDHGDPVRCDSANARRLYKACPWVVPQLTEAMDDHESFFSKDSQES